jgi:predicted SAM-dependent methyltransferase
MLGAGAILEGAAVTIKLNLGCGPHPAPGWVNVDSFQWPEWPNHIIRACPGTRRRFPPDTELPYLQDVLDGLPWSDGFADGAVAHHVLQMVSYPDLVPWLREVQRVLKPGAWLRMTLPDAEGAFIAYRTNDRAWFPIDPVLEPSTDGALCLYLNQAGATRSVFTLHWAVQLCERAGFSNAHAHGIPETKATTMGPAWLTELDSRLPESIVVEARA